MENQNPTPNPAPPTENIPTQNPPVQETPSSQVYTSPQPVSPPPFPKSFLSNKIILLIVILLMLLGIGGTYLALNSKSKPQPVVSKPTPTSAPTPLPTEASAKAGTPDPTANWKTYTNAAYKYSVRYPATMTLSVNNADNSVLFKTQSGDGVNINVSDLRTIPSLRQDINTLLSSPIGYEVKEGKTIIRTVKKLNQFDLGGEQAIKVSITEKDDVVTVYATAVFLIKDNFSYSINTVPTTDASRKEELLKTLDQILSTFRFD